MTLLDDENIQSQLPRYPGWAYQDKSLVKQFELDSFMDVVNLVNAVAQKAEIADHHPDTFINYRRITFTISTHDQGGVTEKDFVLAKDIERLTSP